MPVRCLALCVHVGAGGCSRCWLKVCPGSMLAHARCPALPIVKHRGCCVMFNGASLLRSAGEAAPEPEPDPAVAGGEVDGAPDCDGAAAAGALGSSSAARLPAMTTCRICYNFFYIILKNTYNRKKKCS